MASMNNTHFHFESKDNEFHLFTKIEICIEFLLTLIGSVLYFIIIHYEMFGGDPMKRSIVNKFVSANCFASMLGTFVITTSILLRIMFGAFGLVISRIITYVIIFHFFFIFEHIIMIFTLKVSQRMNYNFINSLNEGFWFFSLEIISTFICFFLTTRIFFRFETLPFTQALAGVPVGTFYKGDGR